MKKNKSEKLKNKRGITLIALVITIIVLIILAAISLMMLSGNDGILNRAGNGKQIQGQATIEEEVKRAILALQIDEKGKNNDITPAKVAEQVNKDNGRTDVTAEGESFPTNIIFPKENSKVYVNLDLSIGKKDDSGSGGGNVIVDGVYSEDVDESEVASDDIFIKEVINSASNNTQVASENGIDKLPTATARIKGIKPEYLYGTSNELGDKQYGINYEGITNKLVIPAQVDIDGKMYKVVEVNLVGGSGISTSLPNIETIIYPNTVEKIYGIANIDEMAAFDNYRKLKKVVLPENITEIPNGFFYHSSIENIEIPRSVEKIGEFAFYNSNIKKLVVYENVKSIEKYAFRWCYNLEEVEFKEGIEELGNNIFEDCNKLTTITLPSTIKSIAFDCFNLSSIRTVRINKDKSEFGKEDSEDWGLSSGSQIIWNDQTETIQ